MAILRSLLTLPVYTLTAFIDALFLLIFFRLISHRWRPRWLGRLNSKAKPAVDWYAGYVEKGLGHISGKVFPEQTTLFVGMLVLTFIRFTLAALFSTP